MNKTTCAFMFTALITLSSHSMETNHQSPEGKQKHADKRARDARLKVNIHEQKQVLKKIIEDREQK